MKKIVNFLLVTAFMLFSAISLQAQSYRATDGFVPAKAYITGDGFEMVHNVAVDIYVDSSYNHVDFQVRSEMVDYYFVHFNVDYMNCTENGYCLHLDKNSTLVIENTMLGKEYKLTMRNTEDADITKLVFLFYIMY